MNMEFLSQLVPVSGVGLRLLGAALILVFGHLAVKLVKTGFTRLGEAETKKSLKMKEERTNLLTSVLDAIVILLALAYLNVGLSSRLETTIVQQAPKFFSVILIAFFGVIVINIVEKVLKDFFRTLGLKNYLREAGISSASFNIISAAVKVFLYVILAQVILYQLELNIVLINQFLNAFSWAFAFLLAAVFFYSIKDLVRNFGAGFYLDNSNALRAGEVVEIDGERGEIQKVSLFGTSIETMDGYTQLKPNAKIIEEGIKFKEGKTDIEALEEIVSYFTSEEGLNSSLNIALDVFGVEKEVELEEVKDSEVIGEKTDSKVKAAWIESENISDLEEEYKAWFKEGALIVSDLDKSEIFSNKPGRNVLSVGSEGEDILNIDPDASSPGRVYYLDSERMEDLMSGGGYLVIAPEGTNAYWRIEKKLLYGDKGLYEDLSKTLENRLNKIMRQGRILQDVAPESLKDYLEKWNDSISSWRPRGGDSDEAFGNN